MGIDDIPEETYLMLIFYNLVDWSRVYVPKKYKRLTIDATLPTLSDTGIIFDPEARNNIMLLLKKQKVKQKKQVISKIPIRPSTSRYSEPQFYSGKRGPFTGLINSKSRTCYLNSFLQAIFMTPEFRNRVLSWKLNDRCNGFLWGLQKLFLIMKETKSQAVSTKYLTNTFNWYKRHALDQQDVQELLNAFLVELEISLKNSGLTNFIPELFEGALKSTIICGKCGTNKFQHMILRDVQLSTTNYETNKPYGTLEEALKGYISTESLVGDNQFSCSTCKIKTDSTKSLGFVKLPYILNFCLLRFKYDTRSWKVNDMLKFPQILNMNDYVTSEGQEIELNYELFCVIVHGGSTSHGHYYALIKDFNSGSWFKFNDEAVNKISEENLKLAFGGSCTSNAYLLCYRKVSSLNQDFISTANLELSTKQLLKEYLSEISEPMFLKNVFYQMNGVMETNIFCMHGDATVEDLISKAYKHWHPYVNGPVTQYRIFVYQPDKNITIQIIENHRSINYLGTEDYKNILFKICNDKSAVMQNWSVSNRDGGEKVLFNFNNELNIFMNTYYKFKFLTKFTVQTGSILKYLSYMEKSVMNLEILKPTYGENLRGIECSIDKGLKTSTNDQMETIQCYLVKVVEYLGMKNRNIKIHHDRKTKTITVEIE